MSEADTVKVVLSEEWDARLYFAELAAAADAEGALDVPRAQWERWQKIEREFDAMQEERAALMERHDLA